MKRLVIMLIASLITCWAAAQSPVADTGVAVNPAQIAVDGDSLTADSTMIAVPADDYDDYGDEPEGLSGAKRNPIYYFGHDFSTFFTEIQCLAGTNDVGIGVSLSCVPEVWGGYVSIMEGAERVWGAAGVEYRLSSPWQSRDWHVYGGMAVGDGVGGEIGVRLSAGRQVNQGNFSWISGSLGMRVTSGGIYCTAGFSLGLSGLMAFLLLI